MADNGKQTVKIVPDQRQLKGLYAAFRNMDEASKNALKTEVTGISAWSADQLRDSYLWNPYPKQAEKVIATIRPNKDKIPNVTIGGSKGKFSGGAVSGQVLLVRNLAVRLTFLMVVVAFRLGLRLRGAVTQVMEFSKNYLRFNRNLRSVGSLPLKLTS